MWLGIAQVIAGITSGFLEQVFYGGRLDENNVVQDSFFLPLAFILMFLGGSSPFQSICADRRHKTDPELERNKEMQLKNKTGFRKRQSCKVSPKLQL